MEGMFSPLRSGTSVSKRIGRRSTSLPLIFGSPNLYCAESLVSFEVVQLTHQVAPRRFDLARAFYGKLLPELGMKLVSDGDRFFYHVGSRTAIGIEPCDPAYAGERFVQQRVGLHHLCLRARSREDVDRCAALLKEMNAIIIRGPAEDTWAPGYYSVLFEDPDGIRLEVNFVPGAGLLAEGAQFRPGPPSTG